MAQASIEFGKGADPPRGPQSAQEDYEDRDYWLGETCKAVWDYGRGRRQAVVDMGRRMAELTIPEVMPPDGYQTGDNIPGNNQSVGAFCLNNLASKLMFQAFPPGLPMMNIQTIEYKVRKEADQDPALWANLLLGFSGLEEAHRGKLLTTTYTTVYTQYLKLLLVAGNGAWKHVELGCPTFYTPHDYTVRRDRHGRVRQGVVRDKVALRDLDPDIREFVLEQTPDVRATIKDDWVDTIHVYTGVKLVDQGDGKYEWQTWQEYNGSRIPDTEVTSDFETPPIRFDWLIPVPGQDWGKGYCEEYRGDLFAVEAFASGITDGAAIASLMLMFVEPGSMTSIRQIREAKNLSTLPGRAGDVSMFKSEKNNDLSFIAQTLEQAATRLSRAFLAQSSIQRSGERVTKEEIVRLGSELDQAMGGLYSSISQGIDRAGKLRFMLLHEEANHDLPPLPKGVVNIQVTSGLDAMGQSNDANNLLEFGTGVQQVLGPQGAAAALSAGDFVARFAAAKGIQHPSSLIKSDAQQQQEQQANQQQASQADMLSKAAGPLAGAAGGALAQQYAQANPPPPAPAQ